MTQDPHRDFCGKQHKIIAHFLAIQAWHRGLDCLVLSRWDLHKLLDLHRFKSARINWLIEDLKSWFPHHREFYDTRAASSIQALWIARVALESLPEGSMTTENRLKGARAFGLNAGTLSDSSSGIPSHREIVSYLAILADGLGDPNVQYEITPITRKP